MINYKRLIKKLARELRYAETTWYKAVWQLLTIFVRGFVFKPVAFIIAHDNRVRRFAYFLNFYARKPGIPLLTKEENA